MKYFLISGEASGDVHAAELMKALKTLDSAAKFCFLGGDKMSAVAGEKPVVHHREMAFMGIWAVLKKMRKIRKNFKITHEALLKFQPDAVILIDYPSFNLRIAKFVKTRLHAQVHYYISPKLWVWKEYRIKAIKKFVDKMYCIFPFEVEFYKKHNFVVEYVGNPTVEEISALERTPAVSPDESPIIALLPGSRRQEIVHCLPKMCRVARRFAEARIVIAATDGVDENFYKTHAFGLEIVKNKTHALLAQATVAVVNSGTATLETAVIGTPQIVVYHTFFPRLAAILKKNLIKTKFVSLVNIIAENEIVPELIADKFTEKNLFSHIEKLLKNERERARQLEGYSKVRSRLGQEFPAKNAAEKIIQALKNL